MIQSRVWRGIGTMLAAGWLLAACDSGGGELREATEARRRQGVPPTDSAVTDDTAKQAAPGDEDLEIPPLVDSTVLAGGRDTTPAPAPPQPDAPQTPPQGGQSLGQWTQGRTAVEHRAREIAVLGGMRVGRNEGFDRLVLEFQGGRIPSYRVEFDDGPIEACGSGERENVPGGAWLAVRLEMTQAHTDAGQPTVTPRRLTPGMPVLKAAQLVCDYEGQVEVVLGLAGRRPYRVTEVSNPARLVIDVQQ